MNQENSGYPIGYAKPPVHRWLELMGWTAPAERHRVPKVVVVV